MSVQRQIRLFLRRFGIEVARYDTLQSADARMQARLVANSIDTVIDVGANDGGYARGLLDAGFQGRVLSFEPLAHAHQALLLHAAEHPRWAVAPRMALGEANGHVDINLAGNSTSSSILPMLERHALAAPTSRYVGQEQVPLFRLDAVGHPAIEGAGKIHLKVDTQGYEMPVLRGAEGLMPRVHGLQLEMSLLPLYDGQVLYRELMEWASVRGFELHGLTPGFTDPSSGRMLQMDGIFFRA